MAFTTKTIDVPKTCKSFTINLKAQGTMSKTVMGYNLVITKEADKDVANTEAVMWVLQIILLRLKRQTRYCKYNCYCWW